MSPGVPYVSVRSNDVLNGSLDLVLRLCTRVDTVWRVLRPGREVGIFLLDPLTSGATIHQQHNAHTMDSVGVHTLSSAPRRAGRLLRVS